jgi:hypothetical protein
MAIKSTMAALKQQQNHSIWFKPAPVPAHWRHQVWTTPPLANIIIIKPPNQAIASTPSAPCPAPPPPGSNNIININIMLAANNRVASWRQMFHRRIYPNKPPPTRVAVRVLAAPVPSASASPVAVPGPVPTPISVNAPSPVSVANAVDKDTSPSPSNVSQPPVEMENPSDADDPSPPPRTPSLMPPRVSPKPLVSRPVPRRLKLPKELLGLSSCRGREGGMARQQQQQ